MKPFKILVIAVIAMAVSAATNAQVTKVTLQASGLTCSMCSNSINRSLKTLGFVEHVNPNIQTSTFEITFKPGSSVDFDALKRKVEDAGFSVANFKATLYFKNVQVNQMQPVTVDDKTFRFLNVTQQLLNGLKEIRLVDKGFISGKEYKRNAALMPPGEKGIYSVTI